MFLIIISDINLLKFDGVYLGEDNLKVGKMN